MIDNDVVERANLFLLLVADAAADQTSGRTQPGRDIFGPMLLLVFMPNSSNVARCRAGCALREGSSRLRISQRPLHMSTLQSTDESKTRTGKERLGKKWTDEQRVRQLQCSRR
jgi:hypothetical protein